MLFILMGALLILLGALGLKLAGEPESFAGRVLKVFLNFCFVLILSTFIWFGMYSDVSGYEEPEKVSTTEIVSVRDEVISEGINSYTYYVEVDSPYASNSQKAYESKTISKNKVTIVEDDSYTEAKLVTYLRHGKKSLWTFAIRTETYEYVFYVPTGTITQDVSVG